MAERVLDDWERIESVFDPYRVEGLSCLGGRSGRWGQEGLTRNELRYYEPRGYGLAERVRG